MSVNAAERREIMENKLEMLSRMRLRRLELGYSYQDLADKTGFNKFTLQRYETGKTAKLPLDKAEIIAKALETSVEYLLGLEYAEKPSGGFADVFSIPVFDSASAGFGCYADSKAAGSKPTFLENAAEAGEYLWINVKGDSMSPKIENGDMILVRRQDSVENGNVAVVMIDDEAVVKKVKYGRGWVELHSFNPYYPVRRFEKQEAQKIKVVGLVKEVCKKL